jgi:hypothetical protein
MANQQTEEQSTTLAELKDLAEKKNNMTLLVAQKDGGFGIYIHPDETDPAGALLRATLVIMQERAGKS